MSRNKSHGRASVSATQRKAVFVLICCIFAVLITIAAAVILPKKLEFGGKDGYDPELYPVDTTLGAVLAQTSDAGAEYLTSTLFIGDQYMKSLLATNQITLNQFVGENDFSISDLIRTSCVNFIGDDKSYTIPQAVALMKPRRVVVTFGSNDAQANTSADAFIQDYKQALQSIASAYPYCDIIVNGTPPVIRGMENSAQEQLLIDEYNQKLAEVCDADGYKYMNSTETLKTNSGYAESEYFNGSSGVFTAAGATEFLTYVRTHAYETEDRRPDTNDVPQRSSEASAADAAATPSPTPRKFAVIYSVEEGRGTLVGNGESGVSTITVEAGEKDTVSITAVASDGYSFYKWSDGQTGETRYDVITQDLSVTAMFNDSRVELTLDRGNTTMNLGESISTTARVRLGGKDYDNSNVQWSVNDDMEGNMGTFTYTPTEPGSVTIKAGLEINGTYASQTFTVTVQGSVETPVVTPVPTPDAIVPGITPTPAPEVPTPETPAAGSIFITPSAATVKSGEIVELLATGDNITGDIVWTCDQLPTWGATGAAIQFSATEAGAYTLRAACGSIVAQCSVTVLAPDIIT